MKTTREDHFQKPPGTRFIELDIFRGCAIVFMIALHLLWDLDYFGILPLNKNFYALNIIVPVIFLLLVGICQVVSTNKHRIQRKTMYIKTVQRGLWVLNLGMLLTLLTAIVLPDRPIMFGVLHCIGCCIILTLPFIAFKPTTTALIGTLLVILGLAISALVTTENPTILQLVAGIHQSNIGQHTIDYFPLIPWLGVCLLGVALGNILYKENTRRFPLPDLSRYTPTRLFTWLGQHSLSIYLFHQPIIVGLLFLYLRI
jgi:uncharacterized membrane protein